MINDNTVVWASYPQCSSRVLGMRHKWLTVNIAPHINRRTTKMVFQNFMKIHLAWVKQQNVTQFVLACEWKVAIACGQKQRSVNLPRARATTIEPGTPRCQASTLPLVHATFSQALHILETHIASAVVCWCIRYVCTETLFLSLTLGWQPNSFALTNSSLTALYHISY